MRWFMDKIQFLSTKIIRDLDQSAIKDFKIPGIVLMENAGRRVADYLFTQAGKKTVAICCGKGNNGGDGLVIARHLDNYRVPVKVLLFANPEQLSGDAAINYAIVCKSQIPVDIYAEDSIKCDRLNHAFENTTWVVDALLGTGLKGAVKGSYFQAIEAINNATHTEVLAVDIPSGLDGDTGTPLGIAVKATHTLTFVAAKQGFAQPQAAQFLGKLKIIDIGIPRILLESVIK